MCNAAISVLFILEAEEAKVLMRSLTESSGWFNTSIACIYFKKCVQDMKFLFVCIYSHKMGILISGNSVTIQIFLLLL